MNKTLVSSLFVLLIAGAGLTYFTVVESKKESNASVDGASESADLVVGGKKAPTSDVDIPKVENSVLVFTNGDNKEVGRLIIGDTVSFTGSLDQSGLIFATYVANQLTLNCEKLKQNSPFKDIPSATQEKPATQEPTKK